MGGGCINCGYDKIAKDRSLSLTEFITRSNKIHNDRYDYSKVKYINYKTEVKIMCKIHGLFYQK